MWSAPDPGPPCGANPRPVTTDPIISSSSHTPWGRSSDRPHVREEAWLGEVTGPRSQGREAAGHPPLPCCFQRARGYCDSCLGGQPEHSFPSAQGRPRGGLTRPWPLREAEVEEAHRIWRQLGWTRQATPLSARGMRNSWVSSRNLFYKLSR